MFWQKKFEIIVFNLFIDKQVGTQNNFIPLRISFGSEISNLEINRLT